MKLNNKLKWGVKCEFIIRMIKDRISLEVIADEFQAVGKENIQQVNR